MVSGSQLQVAKLAQMCPAAPSSARWPAATRVKTPGQNPRSKPRVKTWFKTQMEHLGAPNVLLKQTRHLFMSV